MPGYEKDLKFILFLHDCKKQQSDQKSCLPLLERMGFRVLNEYDTDNATRK
jgi:hypothetical protein